jgi:hypothetical protein
MAAEEKSKKQQIEELMNAIGATSEMALVFYRGVLANGASSEEAVKLTQAFIAAFLYGNTGPHS